MEAPARGYILKGESNDAYRSTAHGWMVRNNKRIVHNKNGKRYTRKELEDSIINFHKK
jgi:hypothetical protein